MQDSVNAMIPKALFSYSAFLFFFFFLIHYFLTLHFIFTSNVPLLQKPDISGNLKDLVCVSVTVSLIIKAKLLLHRHMLFKRLVSLAPFIKYIVCKLFSHLKSKLKFLL